MLVNKPPPEEETDENEDVEMVDIANIHSVDFSLIAKAINCKIDRLWTREEFQKLMEELRLSYNIVTRERQRLKNELRTIEHEYERHEEEQLSHPAKRRKLEKADDLLYVPPPPLTNHVRRSTNRRSNIPKCGYPIGDGKDGNFCERTGFCPYHDHLKKSNAIIHPWVYYQDYRKEKIRREREREDQVKKQNSEQERWKSTNYKLLGEATRPELFEKKINIDLPVLPVPEEPIKNEVVEKKIEEKENDLSSK